MKAVKKRERSIIQNMRFRKFSYERSCFSSAYDQRESLPFLSYRILNMTMHRKHMKYTKSLRVVYRLIKKHDKHINFTSRELSDFIFF